MQDNKQYPPQQYPPQQGQPAVQYTAPPPGYQPGQPGAQPPVYIATTYQPTQLLNPGFKAKRELGCGITLTVFGCLYLINGFVEMSKGRSKFYQGFWGGALFLVTGVMGIMAGKTRKNGYMIASIVLCVISAILSFVCFAILLFAAVVLMNGGHLFAMFGILTIINAIVALVVFIIAIVQAATCCKCCYGPEAQQAAPVSNAAV
ncbi:uncharacterized protein LOC141904609 [Tubulanus polymorphus]|uniref:uncharacterized protein LOC141904609 n=1 Tax=Tubulanus polymorphus TaxID=672921 RepID=UPI003DA60775